MLITSLLLSVALAQSEPSPTALPTAPDASDTDAGPSVPLEVLLPSDPAALRESVRESLKSEGVADAMLAEQVERIASRIELERSLTPTSGDVVLRDGLATLHLGTEYAYLDPKQTTEIIVAWGNPPPSQPPLGMILPAGSSPFSDGWAVIVDYDDQGHVDDSEAASMDFAALLKDMQQGTIDANPDRQAAGYDALELVGWAEPPHYDPTAKKLYWAQHLRSSSGDSLNYDIRVLGRRGVLSLSAVSDLAGLTQVKSGMDALLPRVDFNPGESYGDFDPEVDKVAALGIGALIAGGLATKAGLFKMLFVGLLAGKKFVFLGLAAAFGAFNAWRGKKPAEPPTS